jgi:hypothetical protein
LKGNAVVLRAFDQEILRVRTGCAEQSNLWRVWQVPDLIDLDACGCSLRKRERPDADLDNKK